MAKDTDKNSLKKIRTRARELGKTMTPAEEMLWQQLRGRRLGGLKFRRQHPLGNLIVDFYCAEHRLVIEVDGGIHAAQRESDAERTQQLVDHGYRVIRLTNKQVEEAVGETLSIILAACRET
jgi:very-short-patch-repair endonuclease